MRFREGERGGAKHVYALTPNQHATGLAWTDAIAGCWRNWVCGEKGNLLRSLVVVLSTHSKRRSATVGLSSFIQLRSFKSPVRVIAAFLLRCRDTQAKRALEKSREIENLKRINERQERTIANMEQDLAAMKLRVAQLGAENQRQREQPAVLPYDPPLPYHEFGPKTIKTGRQNRRPAGRRRRWGGRTARRGRSPPKTARRPGHFE